MKIYFNVRKLKEKEGKQKIILTQLNLLEKNKQNRF